MGERVQPSMKGLMVGSVETDFFYFPPKLFILIRVEIASTCVGESNDQAKSKERCQRLDSERRLEEIFKDSKWMQE